METSAENRPSDWPVIEARDEPSDHGYPSHFQYGHAFLSAIMMPDTLRARLNGHEIHVPKEMVAVLNSIVKTYYKKLNEQEQSLNVLLHAFYENITILLRPIHYLAHHLPPGLQMPPPVI